MRFWVYGVDAASREPCDPLFLEADCEAAARKQATEQGILVEDVEAVQPRSSTAIMAPLPLREPGPILRFFLSENWLPRLLIVVLRVLAGVAAIWGIFNIGVSIEAVDAVSRQATQMERVSPVIVSSARSAAMLAVFSALIFSVALVAIFLALAEGLRLALRIEQQTRGQQASSKEERSKRR
jgi:hypothetical protein